jgi:preprotein translocase subunit SecA
VIAAAGAGVGAATALAPPPRAAATQGTVVNDETKEVGRNDPCWCGSGKKFKRCHGA